MLPLPVVGSVQMKESISNGRAPWGRERSHLHPIRTKPGRTHCGEVAAVGGGTRQGNVYSWCGAILRDSLRGGRSL